MLSADLPLNIWIFFFFSNMSLYFQLLYSRRQCFYFFNFLTVKNYISVDHILTLQGAIYLFQPSIFNRLSNMFVPLLIFL